MKTYSITERLRFPNPLFIREDFALLNGEWAFKTEQNSAYDKVIQVPFTYETALSGIGDQSAREYVSYEREVEIKDHNGRILLHFEAVDYEAVVYINDKELKHHVGGYTAFAVDITDNVKTGTNVVRVDVFDSMDKQQLRGKQRSRKESYECWYVQNTGIWKNVWMEYTGSTYLVSSYFTGDAEGNVNYELCLSDDCDVEISIDGKIINTTSEGGVVSGTFVWDKPVLWDIDSPRLYEIEILVHGSVCDKVNTYMAFRSVAVDKDKILVNGNEIYLKMILHQGYYENSSVTPPSTDILEKDVKLIKSCGFNGIRMHQKIETFAFYYLCDALGVYVWGEIPSAYEFGERMMKEFHRDALQIVEQLKGFPSIITYVVFNESWGIFGVRDRKDIQAYTEKMLKEIRKADATRLININDGWHQLPGDLLSLHDYEQNADVFYEEYKNKDYVVTDKIINGLGKAFSEGYCYEGQPMLISEFGGVAAKCDDGWGYGEKANNKEEAMNRIRNLMDAVKKLPYISGYCYTQYTDVEQETNGLFTINRTPKFPIDFIRSVNE